MVLLLLSTRHYNSNLQGAQANRRHSFNGQLCCVNSGKTIEFCRFWFIKFYEMLDFFKKKFKYELWILSAQKGSLHGTSNICTTVESEFEKNDREKH